MTSCPTTKLASAFERGPAQPGADGGMVELALVRPDGATVIESENLVRQVQSINYEFESFGQAIAALHVELKVTVQVVVAQWPRLTEQRAILILICKDVLLIVRQADSHGEPATVIGWAQVPGIGGLPQQRRMIRTSRQPVRAGGRKAIVSRETQASQNARQERPALFVSRFPAPHISAARVDRCSLEERGSGVTRVFYSSGLHIDNRILNVLVKKACCN